MDLAERSSRERPYSLSQRESEMQWDSDSQDETKPLTKKVYVWWFWLVADALREQRGWHLHASRVYVVGAQDRAHRHAATRGRGTAPVRR